MVRINLLEPSALSDQHLIAEYSEILRLLGYVRKHPGTSSNDAHFLKNPVRYFSDKLAYLKKRHALLRKEMKKRGFRCSLTPKLRCFGKARKKDFTPNKKQVREIKKRITERLCKPPRKHFYRYYRKRAPTKFLVKLIRNATV